MGSDSYWLNEEMPKFGTLEGAHKADVAVVGGGLCGLNAALLLQRAGVSVVLIEANRIGNGTSGHTTAKITAQQGVIYSNLIKKWGQDVAQAHAMSQTRAIEQYAELIDELSIDCDFVRADAYTFSNTAQNAEKLYKETDAAQKCGLVADMHEESELPFEVLASMRFKNQAMFHPVKYMRAVALELSKGGCRIFENSRMLEYQEGRVITDRGSVTAGHVIMATRYPIINAPGYYFIKLQQNRSNVLAMRGGNVRGMHLSLDGDGFSVRMNRDVLIVSGFDYKCGARRPVKRHDRLANHAKKHFGGAVINRWSAQDGMPPDDLPYIGEYARSMPRLLTAAGFAKWGITGSMTAANILRDIIMGINNPLAQVYSPRRSIFPGLGAIAGNMAAMAASYIGGIVRRDDPICSHMGCRLRFNNEEGSYDCPCHGSRFTKDAHVIDAPARLPFKKK
jgi:glycine/D-amino acid oxidase-like deaminating enzyme